MVLRAAAAGNLKKIAIGRFAKLGAASFVVMALQPDYRSIYKIVGNCKISTDIYLPKTSNRSSPSTKYPVLINLHGGAFMLGASSIVNKDQIQDCLDRGWIVVVPNHRLCPQVNIYEGPVTDIRDLLTWIYDGSLDRVLSENGVGNLQCNLDQVMAFGTSAGGHLALCLGFDVPRPVAAILDFYGPCNFASSFWTSKLPLAAKLPKFPPDFLKKTYDEDPVATEGGVSLEGQQTQGPDFSDPRQAFAMTHIANGSLFDVCFPLKDWKKIDPILNIGKNFPPTCIVHGQADTMVPIDLSRDLSALLESKGVKSVMIEVPGEEHTFAGKMLLGDKTWNLQRKGFDFLEELKSKV